jgi:deoxyribonuclease-4
VDAGTELEDGLANWRKALERLETTVPVLIENTAGGSHALSRTIETIARLWEHLDGFDVGFCLDTCHAHAAGEDLSTVVERVLDATGRIDLVHANDSKDDPGSGRDRHERLGKGRIDPDQFTAIVKAAGAPVVLETPGGLEAQADDIAWLRSRVG